MTENTRAWRARAALKSHAPAPALAAYRRWVWPRITRQRTYVRFSSWARVGRELRDELGTPRVSFEPDGIWVTDAQGLEWSYDPDEWQSALGKEVGWEHEKAELAHVISAVRPGGTYVDIGGHVGGFAIPVAKAHDAVSIHLFEPVPSTRARLKMNLARNGVTDRVHVWTCALGAEVQRSRMTAVDGGANRLVPTGRAGPGEVDVEVETLDGLLLDHVERVDVIKCDIEGGELPAMRGAEQVLKRDQPDLLLEIDRRFTPRFDYQPFELFDYLAALGYRWFLFADGCCRPGSGIENDLDRANNFLFTTD